MDLSLGVDDGGVCRAGAHVQNGQGLIGARGSEGAADGHVGLHAAHLNRNPDLLGKLPGDGLHLEAVRLDHGGDAHGVLLGKLVGQAALNLLGCERVDRQQILNLDVLGVLAGQIRHDLAHLLQHAAGVGSRLSPHILQAGNGLHGLHDPVGPVVHIHLDAAVFPQQLNRAGRNFPLLHVSGRGLDHHRRAVSNQSPGDGHHLPGLIGGQAKQGGDAVGVGEHLHHAAHGGHLHGGTHTDGHLVNQRHLVYDRDLAGQAVVNQHAVIPLDNGCGDLAVTGGGPVDQPGRHLKVHRPGHHCNIVLPDRRLFQLRDEDRLAYAHTHSAGCGRVVADHGGFGDDGLGNGLHGHIADDGGGFVQAHLRQLLELQPGLLQSVGQGVKDAVDVLAGPLDARGGDGSAGQKDRMTALEPGQCCLCCRVSDVNACDQFHSGAS